MEGILLALLWGQRSHAASETQKKTSRDETKA